ncbi:MAG TPA: hypothetical protein VJV39_22435 [Dongiaceae bacterium]|nr:hypothetical protein [Dongiaceae bacterium]
MAYVLAFLVITAGIALVWARRRRERAEDAERLPTTKRFFGGWIVLLVGGFVAVAILFMVISVGTVNRTGSLLKSIDGCVNC